MSAPVQPGASARSALAQRIRSNLAETRPTELAVIDVTSPVVAERHASRDFYRRRVLALVDAAALTVGILTASAVHTSVHFSTHGMWGLATILAWIVLFNLYGLYTADTRRISHSGADEIPSIFHAFLIGSACLWIYFQHAPPGKVEFAPIGLFAAVAAGSMVALRAVVRAGFARLLGPERVLFVGSGWSTGALMGRMLRGSAPALSPVGMITADRSVAVPRDLPVLGELSDTDLARIVAQHGIHRVVVDAHGLQEDELLALLKRCKQLNVKISVLPAAFGVVGTSAAVDHVGGIALLALNPPVLPRSARIIKRSMDVVGALALLVVLSPLLLAIGAAVRLDSRGPVFFRQWRVGRSGLRFRIFKFRTMVVDAEERYAELLEHSLDRNWLLLDDDPRATRVGRFLRRTSLDEIPQLLNVLRGEMSLVGPRPLIPEDDDRVGDWARTRLDLTPGMTGLWQVLGRTTIPFEEMVKLDYLYVTNWSLWGDVKLVLQTFPVVLARRGAN